MWSAAMRSVAPASSAGFPEGTAGGAPRAQGEEWRPAGEQTTKSTGRGVATSRRADDGACKQRPKKPVAILAQAAQPPSAWIPSQCCPPKYFSPQEVCIAGKVRRRYGWLLPDGHQAAIKGSMFINIWIGTSISRNMSSIISFINLFINS